MSSSIYKLPQNQLYCKQHIDVYLRHQMPLALADYQNLKHEIVGNLKKVTIGKYDLLSINVSDCPRQYCTTHTSSLLSIVRANNRICSIPELKFASKSQNSDGKCRYSIYTHNKWARQVRADRERNVMKAIQNISVPRTCHWWV